ncbi:MAG: DNA repair protein RecO [Hyphomicrobium sp.]
MEWTDEGVVLGAKSHGETNVVVELFTQDHGRHLGLLHGGQSRKKVPTIQCGNLVNLTWKSRLSEQLGYLTLELKNCYSVQAMEDPPALAALSSLCSLLRLLPERDPHSILYEVTVLFLSYLNDASVWPAVYVRWEVVLLQELGFGLDLSQCASTGVTENLIYVSPKSGRAVSQSAGAPYHDRLLPLPSFLSQERSARLTKEDLSHGLALTGHFLETRILAARGIQLPEARGRILKFSNI